MDKNAQRACDLLSDEIMRQRVQISRLRRYGALAFIGGMAVGMAILQTVI